jgi:predicted nucleic acid-binding protein
MSREIVLDANILIRAVLGQRVIELIETYAGRVSFVCPEQAFDEAEKHLPAITKRRGGDARAQQTVLDALGQLAKFIEIIPQVTFESFEAEARMRLRGRDEEDWTYLALALMLECPIWSEDTDFFGAGVAIWTTDRVETYLKLAEVRED